MATTTQTSVGYSRPSPGGELPIIVGILAILVGLVGVFFLVIGVLVLVAAFGIIVLPGAVALSPFVGSLLFAGAVTTIFGAVLVAVASGLWDLELWALCITIIAIVGVIALLVLTASFGWGLLIASVLLVYLLAVSNHFW